MSSELATAFNALAERLALLAAQDQGFRDDLNALARKLVSATENRESPDANCQCGEQPTEIVPAVDESPVDGEQANKCLPMLTLGRTSSVITDKLPENVRNRPRTISDDDLDEIAARSRLKAEAMRWASTRRQLLHNGANFREEIAPGDRDLISRAKLRRDCHLWMCSPSFIIPEDLTFLEDAAKCFDLLADAIGVVRKVLGDPELEKEFLGSLMEVLAYRQSALRVALGRASDRVDADQASVYEWLRSTANRNQMYLGHFMRLDDPADPSSLDEIRSILADTDDRIAGKRQTAKQKKACLTKLRYHAKLIGETGGTESDRKSIIEAVEELLRQGVPPSDVEIRDSLLPIIDEWPEGSELPKGYNLVLREIRRFMNLDEEHWDRSPTTADDDQIKRAARLLAGQTAILIGGELRPHTHAAIKSALRLKDLIWVGVNDIHSVTELEPYVERPEVAVVLVAIRWSRHSFGDVSRYCGRHGKPFVRLPGGCNARQVASQILAQCGDRLARARDGEQPS